MNTINNLNKSFKAIIIILIAASSFIACDKEEAEKEELDLGFKQSMGYTSSDATLAGGTQVKIGIEAETENDKDPLIKFNISESINGGSSATVYSEDLNDKDFEYDYVFTLDTISGETHKYTFTVTNKDGLNAQKSLSITVE